MWRGDHQYVSQLDPYQLINNDLMNGPRPLTRFPAMRLLSHSAALIRANVTQSTRHVNAAPPVVILCNVCFLPFTFSRVKIVTASAQCHTFFSMTLLLCPRACITTSHAASNYFLILSKLVTQRNASLMIALISRMSLCSGVSAFFSGDTRNCAFFPQRIVTRKSIYLTYVIKECEERNMIEQSSADWRRSSRLLKIITCSLSYWGG